MGWAKTHKNQGNSNQNLELMRTFHPFQNCRIIWKVQLGLGMCCHFGLRACSYTASSREGAALLQQQRAAWRSVSNLLHGHGKKMVKNHLMLEAKISKKITFGGSKDENVGHIIRNHRWPKGIVALASRFFKYQHDVAILKGKYTCSWISIKFASLEEVYHVATLMWDLASHKIFSDQGCFFANDKSGTRSEVFQGQNGCHMVTRQLNTSAARSS